VLTSMSRPSTSLSNYGARFGPSRFLASSCALARMRSVPPTPVFAACPNARPFALLPDAVLVAVSAMLCDVELFSDGTVPFLPGNTFVDPNVRTPFSQPLHPLQHSPGCWKNDVPYFCSRCFNPPINTLHAFTSPPSAPMAQPGEENAN
jgi:hypothetical protein